MQDDEQRRRRKAWAMARLGRWAPLGALLLLAAWPAAADPACALMPTAADKAPTRATLDVLTYNVEGLGFPARTGRGADLAKISTHLQAMRKAGSAPDIILFQEVFSTAARRAVSQVGYPTIVHGPARSARRDLSADREDRQGAGKRSIRRGEIGVKFTSSGLAIASSLPVEISKAEPFARGSCAGLDCLANKGALFVRVHVPGAPEPVDIFATHMNSRHASRAPLKRTLPMHHAQAGELAAFIDAEHSADYPAILGGDFNMRHSEARFDFLVSRVPLLLAWKQCLERKSGCEVGISFDGDAPWMDTQDLQFFQSGRQVQIRPLRIEALFDGRPDSPKLSDHDGYRVIYELSWKHVEKRGTCSVESVR